MIARKEGVNEFKVNERFFRVVWTHLIYPGQTKDAQQVANEIRVLRALSPGIGIALVPSYFSNHLRLVYEHERFEPLTMRPDLGDNFALAVGRLIHDLHEDGVLHCNITPKAIVTAQGGWRLAEFGMARLYHEPRAVGNIRRQPFMPQMSTYCDQTDWWGFLMVLIAVKLSEMEFESTFLFAMDINQAVGVMLSRIPADWSAKLEPLVQAIRDPEFNERLFVPRFVDIFSQDVENSLGGMMSCKI